MMKRFLFALLWLVAPFWPVVIAAESSSSAEVEQTVAGLVAQPTVTVVHFWAPWCSNCAKEMGPEGWPKFVAQNPSVKVVFVNVWHEKQEGGHKLAAAGLGTQENFVALTHPNPSSKRGEKLEQFLGLPLQWVPSTWVFREGKMRYALNYGEVRFPMLQQMVEDALELY
jgi:thiol-disulfide isomerase/thioredoxin